AGGLADGPDTSDELARSTGGDAAGCTGCRDGDPQVDPVQPLGAITARRRGQGPDRATVDCPARPGEVQLNPPELNRRRPPSIPPDGGRPVRSPWADRPSSQSGWTMRGP